MKQIPSEALGFVLTPLINQILYEMLGPLGVSGVDDAQGFRNASGC